MTRVQRFFATCLLIVSISMTAFAEAGETQGPGTPPPPPPPPGETQGPGVPVIIEDPTATPSALQAVVDAAGDFVVWIVNIF